MRKSFLRNDRLLADRKRMFCLAELVGMQMFFNPSSGLWQALGYESGHRGVQIDHRV